MWKLYLMTIRSWYARHWWLTPLTVFVIWRIILEIIGQSAFILHPDIIIPWKDNPNPPIWARWDSGWYYSIVNDNYHLKETGTMSNVTFFPLFPLLWKFIEIITPLKGFAAALFTTNILTCLEFIIFYRWMKDKWDKLIALKALIALAIFPTSFFFISAYSESTLFLLIVTTLLLSSRQQWKLAAITVALASASRPTGIFLWPLLLWFWWLHYANKSKPRHEFFTILFIPPVGLIIFSAYLYIKTGNPLAWFTSQSAAGRDLVLPTNLLWAYTKNIFVRGDYWLKHVAEMGALLFTVALLPTLRKIHPAYVFYTILNLLPSLFSNTLTSIQRFVLVIAPLFLAVAMQKKLVYTVYCVISSILLFYNIICFITFQWAG